MTRSLCLFTASRSLSIAWSVSPFWYAITPCTYESSAAWFFVDLPPSPAHPPTMYSAAVNRNVVPALARTARAAVRWSDDEAVAIGEVRMGGCPGAVNANIRPAVCNGQLTRRRATPEPG